MNAIQAIAVDSWILVQAEDAEPVRTRDGAWLNCETLSQALKAAQFLSEPFDHPAVTDGLSPTVCYPVRVSQYKGTVECSVQAKHIQSAAKYRSMDHDPLAHALNETPGYAGKVVDFGTDGPAFILHEGRKIILPAAVKEWACKWDGGVLAVGPITFKLPALVAAKDGGS